MIDSIARGLKEEIRESSRFIVFIWIICRAMGVIPLKIRKCREKGRTVWMASYSRGWLVYSWGILIFTVCMSLYGAVHMTWIRKDLSKFLCSMVIFNVVLMILTASISVGGCGVHAKTFIKARILIEKAQSIIIWSKNTRICINYYKRMSIFFLLIWIANVIGAMVAQSIGEKNIRRPLLFTWYYGGTNAITYFVVLNFTNLIHSMMHTIITVNDTLHKIHKDVNTRSGGYGDLRTKLSAAIEARCIVGRAGYFLAKDQSPVVLVMILSIIFRGVFICNSAVYESRYSGREFFLSFQVLSCFGEIVKLVWIVESCHYYVKIANETKEVMTKLLMLVCDFDLRSDLKYCLRQINEQGIEFTAMHVWTIDRSLVGTVFGLVISNLIVFVQFTD